jgi:hypothetical protein
MHGACTNWAGEFYVNVAGQILPAARCREDADGGIDVRQIGAGCSRCFS